MDANMKQLLDILKNNRIITASQIASIIHLSEKTVRSRLKLLSEELKQNGAELIARQGSGFELKIIDEVVFQQWNQKILSNDNIIPSTSTERVQYILAYLLEHSDYIKVEDLKQMLYVSRNTITADLKQVEYILNLYYLKIERRPNYGIRIEGSELNRRLCIANCIYKNNMSQVVMPKQKSDGHKIMLIVSEIVRKHRLKMSESSFENLIVHTFIAKNRIQKNLFMNYTELVRQELYGLVGEKAITIAKEMSVALYEQIGVHYDEDETIYLALHLSGKVNSDSQGRYGNNLVISSKIDELVLRMLDVVYEGMRLDFRDNLELRMSLNQHLVPLDIRMRYDIPLRNPIIKQIKVEYAFAYTIAVNACSVLIQHYGKELLEDEIGYIAILFALAIEKKSKDPHKYNIVVVCVSGRGTSQLFMYKYKQAFGNYINNIYELTVFDLESLDFKGLKIDYVFTTIPLNMTLPVPIYEVSLFLDNQEISNYKKIFQNGDSSFIHRYFNKSLFIPNLKAESKEEALLKMCDFTKKYKKLPDNFYELVKKREDMGQTDFGNLIAIPHPYHVIEGEKFVVAAILEKPIWWGHNDVQVIFLISLDEDNTQDIEQFYRVITNYFSSLDLVLETINNRKFSNLIVQLEEANKR